MYLRKIETEENSLDFENPVLKREKGHSPRDSSKKTKWDLLHFFIVESLNYPRQMHNKPLFLRWSNVNGLILAF